MIKMVVRLGQHCRHFQSIGISTLKPRSILSNISIKTTSLLSNHIAPPKSSSLLSRNYSLLPVVRYSGYGIGRNSSWHIQCRSTATSFNFAATDIVADVGIMIEGEPSGLSDGQLEELSAELYKDGKVIVQQAAMVLITDEAQEEEGGSQRDSPPGPLELSLVLCDDEHIKALNNEWRGIDAPTDVLSFEMGDGYDDDIEGEDFDASDIVIQEDDSPSLTPFNSVQQDKNNDANNDEIATLLGDVVISLDTAQRQARERGHSLRDECRILLVHGVLHLLGYDHENGDEEAREMADAEQKILQALQWKGQGLIEYAASQEEADTLPSTHEETKHQVARSSSAGKKTNPLRVSRASTSGVTLLALDMDGTLLNSQSQVLSSSVDAIRAAIDRNVTVMLATGKARPAAIAAMQRVGLAGDGLVVSPNHPGIFLQGLAVHDFNGQLIGGGTLKESVVRRAFEYAAQTNTPICGFLGDECITLSMNKSDKRHVEIEELHYRYYEPLAHVVPTVDDVIKSLRTKGMSMRKLLFMTHAEEVESRVKPDWVRILSGEEGENQEASTMQAVPDMLEIVPINWNKLRGIETLISSNPSRGISLDSIMAIGDGNNDLEMVRGVGIGIAMGNAVPAVKAVAVEVVASNNDGGVAEAIDKYILS